MTALCDSFVVALYTEFLLPNQSQHIPTIFSFRGRIIANTWIIKQIHFWWYTYHQLWVSDNIPTACYVYLSLFLPPVVLSNSMPMTNCVYLIEYPYHQLRISDSINTANCVYLFAWFLNNTETNRHLEVFQKPCQTGCLTPISDHRVWQVWLE